MTKNYLEQLEDLVANTEPEWLARKMLDWHADKLDEATYTAEELA